MNTKSLFSVLVIVIIVGRCKKKAKNVNLRKYGTPKYKKTEPFLRLMFSRSENDFFSNFEGTVCFGNRYDKGILNIRPLLCKSIDILLRSVLS